MGDHNQVAIEELISISDKLASTYFQSHDLYSLLILSLMTVTMFSRKRHHLTTTTRLELSIFFLPDLLSNLHTNKSITDDEHKFLLDQIYKRNSEIPSILQAYIHASNGLRGKEKKKNKMFCMLM